MNAKFYKQLTLKSDRQTIAARGPCGWQDGDAWAVVIGRNLDLCVSSRASIKIIRLRLRVSARSSPSPKTQNRCHTGHNDDHP
jgi:hypothetical protein